jgi:glycosyltransferase involved in cell wall biosynthesis
VSAKATSPQVSVVVPAYDHPEFLGEAVRSVLAQEGVELELIVVDDGSPSDLAPAFAGLERDPRLQVVRQENRGAAAARNHGVELARGEWVAFLDHDDVWMPGKLGKQLAALAREPGAGWSYCRYETFGAARGSVWPAAGPAGWVLEDLLERTWIRTLSVVMVRRAAVSGASWFRTDLKIADDIELYYRLAQRCPVVFVPEVLVRKRGHAVNQSSDLGRLHAESLQVLGELAARLGAELTPALRRRLRGRQVRHHLAAAEAAHRSGATDAVRFHLRAALRARPLRIGTWLRWLRHR